MVEVLEARLNQKSIKMGKGVPGLSCPERGGGVDMASCE